MKLALVACLLLVGGTAFAINPYEELFHLRMFVIKAKDFIHVNMKPKDDVGAPDPTKCLNDTQQLRSRQFMECNRYFNEDPTHVTPDQARMFCQRHCSMFLSQLLHRFVEDCDIPQDQRPPPGAFKLLEQACDHPAGQRTTCLEVWNAIDPDSSTIPLSGNYTQCLAEYNGEGTCPQVCKDAEKWVMQHMGCCYTSIMHFGANSTDVHEGILTDKYWNNCGMKEPSYCPSPRD